MFRCKFFFVYLFYILYKIHMCQYKYVCIWIKSHPYITSINFYSKPSIPTCHTYIKKLCIICVPNPQLSPFWRNYRTNPNIHLMSNENFFIFELFLFPVWCFLTSSKSITHFNNNFFLNRFHSADKGFT